MAHNLFEMQMKLVAEATGKHSLLSAGLRIFFPKYINKITIIY